MRDAAVKANDIDRIQAWIAYVAIALPLVGFAAVHLALASTLWNAEQRVPNPRP